MYRGERMLTTKTIPIEKAGLISGLFGDFDSNIKLVEREYGVTVTMRGSELKVSGEEESTVLAVRAISAMQELILKGDALTDQSVRYIFSMVNDNEETRVGELAGGTICITASGRPVRPKTLGQKTYIEAIGKNTVTIGVGPAGTGKTYLAVAVAVAAFKSKKVNRIIITRPAVEAGEKLGFLPGDLQQKVDPYLRPLYDALFDMLGAEQFAHCQERGDIEVAPLAYMRGRTLDDSFIILDEAQNTTTEQMKMFLTRLGYNSKIVVTGDITQIDLPDGKRSGLKEVIKILKNIDGIETVIFDSRDVVRHHLVKEIISAYEKYEEKRK